MTSDIDDPKKDRDQEDLELEEEDDSSEENPDPNSPEEWELPGKLPVVPVRDVVIFPNMVVPLFVGRTGSVTAVNEAMDGDQLLLLLTQRDQGIESPQAEDLYDVGVAAQVVRRLKLADGRLKILVQGVFRVQATAIEEVDGRMLADYVLVPPPDDVDEIDPEIEGVMRAVRELTEKILSFRGLLGSEVVALLEGAEGPGRLADLVASNVKLITAEAQQVLAEPDPIKRINLLHGFLVREVEVASIKVRVQSMAKEEMDKGQRDYFLREQLKAIRRELGDDDERAEEMAAYQEAIDQAKLPPEALKEAEKQLSRLGQMHSDTAEAGVIRTYLDWVVELPWSVSSRDKLDLKRAKRIMDRDHHGLDKVKERVLEFLAVRKLTRKLKGPILCFVGPPGVGKTSLGRSIANAMGRKFTRVSLGGVKDEAEVRGHRRTYIGAMPGRIIQGLKQAGTNNPVFMMDEIDKVGMDFRGDPTAALLEALDPELNHEFRDHYLNLDFDLSKVMFITTANLIDPIPEALADRMEIIEISGYTLLEKSAIARRYLLPRQLKRSGLKKSQVKISEPVMRELITDYTFESGLRDLERSLASLCRKAARAKAEGKSLPLTITSKRLDKYLGPPPYIPELEHDRDEIGVVTGLAWTSGGGDVLFIESSIVKGKGQLLLTGQLGEVMQESAQAALSYARARLDWLGLSDDFYDNIDIHIHLPAGAIPKDGPSAGVTLATALVSSLTGIPVRRDVAMTGEVTLRGKVLPIGGLKEKALAALRFGVKTVLIPEKNASEIRELPKEVRRGLTIKPVSRMDQVLEAALVSQPPGPKPKDPTALGVVPKPEPDYPDPEAR